jgi:hypothetical protein
MVEQSSAAARNLADGTAQLREQIAFFQVEEESNYTGPSRAHAA